MLLETQTLLTITLLSRYTLGLYQVKKCYHKKKKKKNHKIGQNISGGEC